MTRRRLHRVVAAATLVLAVTGCTSGAGGGGSASGQDAQDAAGTTRAQVSELSLEDELGSAGERYSTMQAVLEEAQLQVSDGPWLWNGGDVLPVPAGAYAFGDPLPGADADNSYYFRAGRIIRPEGASGDRADLGPMEEYVDEKGWRSSTAEIGRNLELRADNGDGWWLTWTVRPNGQYSLSVYSEPFWTNDAGELRLAIGKRDVTPFPERSVPGEYEAFPSWSDPVVP